jgi:predicted lysophospholipase L1 biosynthesis ABC-type transport system permease subunit
VGIVGDVTFPINNGPIATPYQMYRPFDQEPDHWLALTYHTTGAAAGLVEETRRVVAQADPDLAVYGLGTVDSLVEKAAANIYLVGDLLTIAALLGLLLALVGIYGVVANLAAQRTQEIGIRMALGAQTRAVLWMILRNGARLAAVGVSIGLLLAFGLNHALTLAMPGIPGSSPPLIFALAVLLVGATLLACWVPARRATRVNPVDALRSD